MPIRSRLALAAALLLLAAPVAAQSGADDAGTFRISVEGREVGTEQFTVRQTGTGRNAEVIATGHVQLTLPTGTLELRPRLRSSGFQAQPVAYEVEIQGDSPRRIVGTVGDGRFSARILSPAGEQLREYVASQGATVLDEGVAHHYYFLASRTHEGRVPVLIPRENRQVMATVAGRGEESIRIGDTSVTAYHLVVTPEGGDERHVWVDVLNRVLRVEIPASGYRAERTEAPR